MAERRCAPPPIPRASRTGGLLRGVDVRDLGVSLNGYKVSSGAHTGSIRLR